ncbi:phospholipase D-like domain-containing protein [Methylocystis echinoides]|uniref:phospholipase D-like domain-containing protein n=1 Tax=Methylocystis echinoides TaxID=29468 RepID=UPI0034185944
MAAYSLTDWPVIDALIDARRRGVAVRIVLDPSQQHAFDRLREIAGAIRMKAQGPICISSPMRSTAGSCARGRQTCQPRA